MLVNEIVFPLTVKDAYVILHKAGYREIGQGNYSRVYAKKGDKSILKLFAPNDVAFKSFVRFTKQNPSIHFPKFSNKVMNIGQYSAIRTELLKPFEGNYDHLLTYIMHNYCIGINEKYSVPEYYLEEANEWMNNNSSLKTASDALIKFMINEKYYPDIKRKNLMLRGNTIVFIDPICGGENSDSRGLMQVTKV